MASGGVHSQTQHDEQHRTDTIGYRLNQLAAISYQFYLKRLIQACVKFTCTRGFENCSASLMEV